MQSLNFLKVVLNWAQCFFDSCHMQKNQLKTLRLHFWVLYSFYFVGFKKSMFAKMKVSLNLFEFYARLFCSSIKINFDAQKTYQKNQNDLQLKNNNLTSVFLLRCFKRFCVYLIIIYSRNIYYKNFGVNYIVNKTYSSLLCITFVRN